MKTPDWEALEARFDSPHCYSGAVEAPQISKPISSTTKWVKYDLFPQVIMERGARVAQSVKCLTLGFGSGHDLRVVSLNSHIRFALGVEPA